MEFWILIWIGMILVFVFGSLKMFVWSGPSVFYIKGGPSDAIFFQLEFGFSNLNEKTLEKFQSCESVWKLIADENFCQILFWAFQLRPKLNVFKILTIEYLCMI